MRGYIRSYGRIINMTEKNISQALSDLGLSDEPQAKLLLLPCYVPEKSKPQQHWLYQLVNFISCYRMVGLVGMWWNSHSRNNSADATANANAALTLQNSPNLTTSASPSDPTPKNWLVQTTLRQHQ